MKFTKTQKEYICLEYLRGENITSLARDWGTSVATISRLLKGKVETRGRWNENKRKEQKQ